jgi:hypothetical protein
VRGKFKKASATLSISGTEIAHFQTWHDKAGNCPPLRGVADPVSGKTVAFPDLSHLSRHEYFANKPHHVFTLLADRG